MKTTKSMLESIEQSNERIKQLRMQGESSNSRTSKRLRHKRNLKIIELMEMLKPELSYYNESIKEKEK